MKTVTIFSLLFLFSICLFAQTPEIEPNNTVNASGVITITANGTYTGNIDNSSGWDVAWWKFAAGTSVIDLDLTDTPSSLNFILYSYDDAAYSNEYPGSINSWLSGYDCAPQSVDPTKYYALKIYKYTAGTYNYSFDVVMESSLPVELLTFQAQVKAEGVLLEWSAESETNNLGFILDRSTDAANWMTLASYQTDNALASHGHSVNRTQYTFTDNTIQSGQDYYYRLADVDAAGTITQHAPLFVSAAHVPDATAMAPAYPNPFNPQTHIAYQLGNESDVTICVFDMLGRQVKSLYNGHQAEGVYNVYWNGTDDSGRQAASGNYIIQMQTEHITQTQKVMFMK